MKRILPAVIGILLCLWPAATAGAEMCEQFSDSASGRKVRVTLESGAAVTGKILRTSTDSIVLRSDGKEIGLDRQQIAHIEVRSRSKMLRNALIGAGVGAVAGVVFGAFHDEADSDSLAIIFGGIGAAAGGPIGAALPARTRLCG
jgi:hypothetical protein